MIDNIRFAREASLRLVSRLRTTPASELLPLFQGYFQRAVKRFKAADAKTLVPLVTHYLGSAFPERGALSIHRLQEINSGWENDVYAFTAQWGGFGHAYSEDLILRVYPGGFAQDRAQKECDMLRMLYSADYPVPRVDIFIGAEESLICKPFLVMERIPGYGMCADMLHTTPEACQKLLPVFCGLQARLHALDWRAIVPDPEKFEPTDCHCVIDRTFEETQPFIESHMLTGFTRAWDWLRQHKHDVICTDPSIVHLDYHPDNVLIKYPEATAKHDAYVIDWTGANISDYRFDLAWTLLLTGSLNGWEKRDAILQEYQRQANRVVEDFEFFEARACFLRLLSVALSLEYGADVVGLRPGSENLIRCQAPSMRLIYEHQLKLTGITMPEIEAFLDEEKA